MAKKFLAAPAYLKANPPPRITVPVKVREIMGIDPTDVIEFKNEDGKIIIEKMK